MIESVPAPRPDGSADAADRRLQAVSDDDVSSDGAAARADRYVQERMLGRGAMGAVYLVRDRETGEQLAFKKLFRMDGKSVLRLKREFRSLADVSHPNLVKMYELGRAADGWFLTMEYVAGEDLQSYLGLGSTRSAGSRIELAIASLASRRARLDDRVLPAFYQLASGVRALHRAGMLHRDLKPSNVVVANHRVVVLDFGLARELDPNAASLTEEGQITGTPAYMAPEQALGKPLTEASDWYAFGVMLYEALTGALPFDGPMFELLRCKLELDPLPPSELAADVPASLNALCMALLARDPAARPKGSEILARLEPVGPQRTTFSLPVSGDTGVQSETHTQAVAPPLVGRGPELAALWQAMRTAEDGRTVVVHVRGVSGAGKSALVEAFLDQVERQGSPSGQPDALVLRSRCYEREAMPFKALDGVIDALSRHLSHVDDFEVSNLLPTDIAALAQLFPVLERLRAVQRLLTVRAAHGDAVQNRQRAEAALRDLFGRLAARRPMVIWIDDLQWGDLDSAGILKSWLQRVADLPLMVVFSYRADEVDTSECLRLLLPSVAEGGAATEVVQVAPLAPADVYALCRQRLGVRAQGQDALVERIVRESQGSPFLAAQLAALAEAKLARGDSDVSALSIGDLVVQTNALLPADAQHLLAVLAVAGRPILPKLALRAAGVRRGGRELLHALRRLQLVRTRDVAGERLVEVYHDRVREGVQRLLLPAQSERIHGSLLAVLEYSGRPDPDWLHTLALGANERVAALRYGLSAAERAEAALAFERAAQLYARCIELSDDGAGHRGELLRKLAAALGRCGRGAMAADAYLEAAKLATGPEAVRLMRLATSHLLRSGHFEQGEAMLQRVLAATGVELPTTPSGMMATIAWERFRVGLRGMRYTPRGEGDVPAAMLTRFDTFDALRLDTSSIDPVRAALFLAHQMRWALDIGEPSRILRALSGVCYLESTSGTARAERRTDELMAQMAALAEKIGTPGARAQECVMRALTSWMLGRPDAVLAPSYEAERLLRTLPTSTIDSEYYVRMAVVSARVGALHELSDYRGFATELHAALEEARATENRAAILQLALNETLLDEINARPEASIARLDRQRQQLPRGCFGVYHALHMLSVYRAAAATREYAWGQRYLDEDWPRYLRSPVRRTANIAFFAQSGRVQLLVSQHLAQGGHEADLPRATRSEITTLARLGGRGAAQADVHRSRLACAAGNQQLAIELMRRAIGGAAGAFDKERTRHALAMMIDGDEGRALRAESEGVLRERGVADPAAFVRASFPELFAAGAGRQRG
jgi:hypothetical protein